jgi:DNA mismatch endonuclease Vsr
MKNSIIGERLKEAREARKMTQEELSSRIGITRASISAFEKGLKYPSVTTVVSLANELGIPMSYLQNDRPIRSERLGPLSYRKKSRATKGIQHQMARFEEWLEDIYSVYCNYIDFPEVNLLPIEEKDYELLDDDAIEGIAGELRTLWGMGIGPIANVLDFLEANGIVVGRASLGSDIDAVSVWRSHRPHILINNALTSCVRIRMNLAHELGHLVLHKLADESDYKNKEKYELMEHQATCFAGCFLFPARSFYKEFSSFKHEALIHLKKRWKVSMGAMVKRAQQLELITEEDVGTFYRQLSAKGYSKKKEPLDDTIPIEEIRLFSDAVEILAENRITLQRVIDETLLSGDDFYRITGIIPQSNIEKNVKILQFRRIIDNDEPVVHGREGNTSDGKVTPLWGSSCSKPESMDVLLRKALWREGIRYRKRYDKLPGKPDIAITKYKIAIFCDDELWQGNDCVKKNQGITTDNEHGKRIREMGWVVIRFCGKEIREELMDCVNKIKEAIDEIKTGYYSEFLVEEA